MGATVYISRKNPRRSSAAAKLQRAWRARRAKPVSLVKKIRSVALRQCETKTAGHQVGAISGSAAVDLYHNVTHYVRNLLATSQGMTANPGATESDNRIGNEVVGRGIKLKLQFISDPVHPNINLKGYVFKYEANETPNDALFWSGPSGAGATMLRFLDTPDTRNVSIVKSFTITNRWAPINGVGTTQTYVHNDYKDLWIPLKDKKIKYDGNNSEIPKYTTYGLCVLAFDANNTLQTDIVSYFSYVAKFYFKDP